MFDMSDGDEDSMYDSSDDEDRFEGMNLSLHNRVYQMQLDRYKMFKDQDQENGHFDLALLVRGQKLYVHRFCLAAASETFNAMVSLRWSKNAEVIEIANPDYSYDDIYQLVNFIYSGECTITKENVFTLTDAAEYFGVLFLKERCVKFFMKMNFVIIDLENTVAFAQRYSMHRVIVVLHRFARRNFKAIIDAEKFLTHKQPFIEFLSETSKRFFEEEQFFTAAYKWAEHHADIAKAESDDDPLADEFDREEYIKAALQKVLNNVDYYELNLKFIKEFILEKRFLFYQTKLYKIIAYCQRENDEEEECFKILCDVARSEALMKSENSMGEKFKFNHVIRDEVGDAIYGIRFFLMSVDFLKDFVVELGFDLPFERLYDYLLTTRILKKEDAFKAVYELAEKLVHQKTSEKLDSLSHDCIIQQVSESSEFPPCSIATKVKNELRVVLKQIKFYEMDPQFLMDFVVEKEITFSLKNFYNSCLKKQIEREERFKIIYNLAEKIVLKKHESLPDGVSTIYEEVKNELVEVLPRINFHLMSPSFLMEFVVEREMSFCFVQLHDTLLNDRNMPRENCFETVYHLAEKLVLQKQTTSPVADFNLIDAVKKELAQVLPNFYFTRMDIDFLTNFVVEHGFLISICDLQTLVCNLKQYYSNEVELFGKILKLIEKQVLQKQKASADKNFHYYSALRNEVFGIRCVFDFSKMNLGYLIKLCEKGLHYLFSETLGKYVAECRNKFDTEESFFEAVYKFVEDVSLQIQKTFRPETFNVLEYIKSEFCFKAKFAFKFDQMKPEFLMEFVVGKGIQLSTTMLRDIFLKWQKDYGSEEKSFKAVYQLAEKQVMQNQIESDVENFNVSQAIKDALVETLQVVLFCNMSEDFLNEFIVKNGILSEQEAARLCYTCVKVTNNNKTISGVFEDKFGIMRAIPINGYYSTPLQYNKHRFTQLKFKIPPTPSILQKMKGVEWYLCLEKDGILAVKHHKSLTRNDDYLIAEMKTEKTEFEFIKNKTACITASYNNV